MIRALAFVLLAAVSGCPSQETAPDEPLIGDAKIQALRAECRESGGRYGSTPTGTLACFTTPKDAGKHCTSAADCQTECLARSMTCAPIEPLFGCNEILSANGTRQTMCRE